MTSSMHVLIPMMSCQAQLCQRIHHQDIIQTTRSMPKQTAVYTVTSTRIKKSTKHCTWGAHIGQINIPMKMKTTTTAFQNFLTSHVTYKRGVAPPHCIHTGVMPGNGARNPYDQIGEWCPRVASGGE